MDISVHTRIFIIVSKKNNVKIGNAQILEAENDVSFEMLKYPRLGLDLDMRIQ